MRKLLVYFMWFSVLGTGCQFSVDVKRYCDCSKKVVEAGAYMSTLTSAMRNAESRSRLRKVWEEHKEKVNQRDETISVCLLELQIIDGSVKELHMAHGRFATNASTILHLLKFAESSSRSVAEIRDAAQSLAREVQKAIDPVSNERERMCNGGAREAGALASLRVTVPKEHVAYE